VARPILDVADERLVAVGELEDPPRQVVILDLLAPADVVDVSRPPLA
jgi:hypothetical protein